MVRLGLVVAVVGLVLWVLARPSPGRAEAPLDRSWQKRALRVLVIGLCIVWFGAVVAIGALR
jgi:hypothetical protein